MREVSVTRGGWAPYNACPGFWCLVSGFLGGFGASSERAGHIMAQDSVDLKRRSYHRSHLFPVVELSPCHSWPSVNMVILSFVCLLVGWFAWRPAGPDTLGPQGSVGGLWM